MVTVLEECTTEEQRSVVPYLWARRLNAKDIRKEMFPVYGWNCLSRKAVHNWVKKFSHGRSKAADNETEVRKWLRQRSKYFYAAGFDALVQRWDKYIDFICVLFYSLHTRAIQKVTSPSLMSANGRRYHDNT
jgi:hypothetical protein